jgi:hypothetical protein
MIERMHFRATGAALSGAALSLLLVLGPRPPCAALAAAARAADLPLEDMPDGSDLRARYWEDYFSAPPRSVSRAASIQRGSGGAFRFSFVDGTDFFYQIVTPLPVGADSKTEIPLYAQGTWILKRAKKGGAPVQVKIFLRSDPGCFARIYPDGDRSRLDLVVYGGVLAREAALPCSFDRAFAAPLSDIVRWSGSVVDWDILSPRPADYAGARALARAIRERLPSLRYAEDGALDAEGRAVRIATGAPQQGPAGLNCSGFAKWIVDGFYGPLAGKYLDPRAMAERRDDTRSNSFARPFEAELDPYFGLDWTRNLAVALSDAVHPSRRHGLFEADVTDAPFALLASQPPAGSINGSSVYEDYPAPERDLGYEGRGLKALLYTLASRDPDAMYLASLSRRGGGPVAGLVRHYHVVIIVPYFEEDGSFRAAVFESAAETSLDSLVSRIGTDFIHLVRLPVLSDFAPPALP